MFSQCWHIIWALCVVCLAHRTQSFIKKKFIEHLQCVRHCVRRQEGTVPALNTLRGCCWWVRECRLGEGAVEQGMSGMDWLGKLQSRPSVAGALTEWADMWLHPPNSWRARKASQKPWGLSWEESAEQGDGWGSWDGRSDEVDLGVGTGGGT